MSLFVLNALFDVTHAVLQAAPEVTPASNPAQYAAAREAELAAASEHEGETPNEPAKAGEDTAAVTKDEVARERH